MDTEEFVQFIKQSKQHQCLYHFTDEANLDSINVHGILSTDERKSKGIDIDPNLCGGDEASHKNDSEKKITDFVCLSFTDDHPLCFLATEAGRLPNPVYLKICPEILLSDGVMFADGVANATRTTIMTIGDAIEEEKIDRKIIYEYNDWKVKEIKDRLWFAKKTEILVPKCVPQNMII